MADDDTFNEVFYSFDCKIQELKKMVTMPKKELVLRGYLGKRYDAVRQGTGRLSLPVFREILKYL